MTLDLVLALLFVGLIGFIMYRALWIVWRDGVRLREDGDEGEAGDGVMVVYPDAPPAAVKRIEVDHEEVAMSPPPPPPDASRCIVFGCSAFPYARLYAASRPEPMVALCRDHFTEDNWRRHRNDQGLAGLRWHTEEGLLI